MQTNQTTGQLERQVQYLENALVNLIDALKYSHCPGCEDEFSSAREQLREKISEIYAEIDRRVLFGEEIVKETKMVA